jgi:hypothetical protein
MAVPELQQLAQVRTYSELRSEVEACAGTAAEVGQINPRPSGFINDRIQDVKKLMRRSLGWYTRPLRVFHATLLATLQKFAAVLDNHQEALSRRALQSDLQASNRRLEDVELGTYHLYELLESAEKHAGQSEDARSEFIAMRDEIRELRAEVMSMRRRLQEDRAEGISVRQGGANGAFVEIGPRQTAVRQED